MTTHNSNSEIYKILVKRLNFWKIFPIDEESIGHEEDFEAPSWHSLLSSYADKGKNRKCIQGGCERLIKLVE